MSNFVFHSISQTVPDSPKSMVLNSRNPTTLLATWEEVDNSNGIVEGYQLELENLDSTESSRAVKVSAQIHQYTWTGLHPYYSYRVSVAAFTSAGTGSRIVMRIQMPETGKYRQKHIY